VALGLVLAIGLGAFGFRFRNYFAGGATSVGARFDYWRAAGQTALHNPVLGSGPGTFQIPYAQIKAPEAEMARLAHNDYLEQFSDSGFVGGFIYAAWIALLVTALARRLWRKHDPIHFAVFLGVLGWLSQGVSEFSLYVPALAWTAFTLGGCLLGLTRNQFDNSTGAR
jgi:O-antigen ligase